jgi:hypothetical protein
MNVIIVRPRCRSPDLLGHIWCDRVRERESRRVTIYAALRIRISGLVTSLLYLGSLLGLSCLIVMVVMLGFLVRMLVGMIDSSRKIIIMSSWRIICGKSRRWKLVWFLFIPRTRVRCAWGTVYYS